MDKLTDYSPIKEHPYLLEPIQVLDKGFLQLIDFHGSDKRIVDAARLSYQSGTKKVNNDENLIDYLMRHKHMSPFEMCSVTFFVKAPLFVVQQMLRHRTAKLNQESARYSVLEEEYYVPNHLRPQSKTNKQAGEGRLQSHLEERNCQLIEVSYDYSSEAYKNLLEDGVCREQARAVLPVGTYTKLMWQSDLRNLFNFIKLRIDSHAQQEIREYANIMNHIVSRLFPLAHKAFEEHVLFAETFSAGELTLIRGFLDIFPEARDAFQQAAKNSGMRETRVNEFIKKLFGRS